MRNLLWIVFLLFISPGCKNKDGIPSTILPPQKMQMVLWDMMRADQFLNDYVINKDTSLKKIPESLKYYQQIFAIHKINKEQFQQSLSFYQSHPVLLKSLMDSISNFRSDTLKQPAKPDTVSSNPVQDTSIKKLKKKEIILN